MKTNFWKSAAAFVVGMAAMVACQKEQMTPVFPQEVITNSDVTTTSESITFTANLDWELSVPQETIAFFWLEDASGNKLNKLSGKAGEVTVKVGITDEPDFNNDITCDVTLKMGEESKVVATYTLLKSVKEFKAFADVITDGNLTWNTEEGGFLYAEQPTTEVTLVYNEIYGFIMPFKFEAGFNYDVECPEWMNVTASALSENAVGKRGVSLVEVSANLEKLTAEDTAGDLKIKVRNSDEVVTTIKVNMPSLADFILCSKDAVNIGIDGKYLGELDACELTVQTTADLTFVLAGMENNGWWATSFNEDPSYKYSVATLTVGEAVVTGLLKTCTLSVAFTPNDAAERKAYLLAMPASEAAKFDNWAANEAAMNAPLNEDYKQYVITTFTQEGKAVEKEILTIKDAEWTRMETTDDNYNWISGAFGELPVYIISATNEFKVSSDDIWNVKFYNMEGQLDEDLFILNPDFMPEWRFSATEETSGLIVFEKWMGEGDYNPEEGDELTPFVAAYVEYVPSAESAAPFAFVYPDYVSGATLAPYADAEALVGMSGEFAYQGVEASNVYELKYTSAMPQNAAITYSATPDQYPWNNWEGTAGYWLEYEFDADVQQMWIFMSTSGLTDYIVFRENMMMKYILVCTYVAE